MEPYQEILSNNVESIRALDTFLNKRARAFWTGSGISSDKYKISKSQCFRSDRLEQGVPFSLSISAAKATAPHKEFLS